MAQLPENIARAITRGISEGLLLCDVSLGAEEEDREENR